MGFIWLGWVHFAGKYFRFWIVFPFIFFYFYFRTNNFLYQRLSIVSFPFSIVDGLNYKASNANDDNDVIDNILPIQLACHLDENYFASPLFVTAQEKKVNKTKYIRFGMFRFLKESEQRKSVSLSKYDKVDDFCGRPSTKRNCLPSKLLSLALFLLHFFFFLRFHIIIMESEMSVDGKQKKKMKHAYKVWLVYDIIGSCWSCTFRQLIENWHFDLNFFLNKKPKYVSSLPFNILIMPFMFGLWNSFCVCRVCCLFNTMFLYIVLFAGFAKIPQLLALFRRVEMCIVR